MNSSPNTCVLSKAILIAAALALFPDVSLSQDWGGVAGALIQGAINAQRMQEQHFRLQAALRLEWRDQDGQDKT